MPAAPCLRAQAGGLHLALKPVAIEPSLMIGSGQSQGTKKSKREPPPHAPFVVQFGFILRPIAVPPTKPSWPRDRGGRCGRQRPPAARQGAAKKTPTGGGGSQGKRALAPSRPRWPRPHLGAAWRRPQPRGARGLGRKPAPGLAPPPSHWPGPPLLARRVPRHDPRGRRRCHRRGRETDN